MSKVALRETGESPEEATKKLEEKAIRFDRIGDIGITKNILRMNSQNEPVYQYTASADYKM